MRNCWAIIAINARSRCKTRLHPYLDVQRRRELACRMLDHVVSVTGAAPGITNVLVVSPEQTGLPANVGFVQDAGRDLNAALDLARLSALTAGADELLLLPADLPSITVRDVQRMIGAVGDCTVAIAPDRVGTGTNALFLAHPSGFEFRFGPDSRLQHEAEARRHGCTSPSVIHSPGLQSDIDTVADLLTLQPMTFQTGSPAPILHAVDS
jgi:2-phospho-L-lactate guanylyltransferase